MYLWNFKMKLYRRVRTKLDEDNWETCQVTVRWTSGFIDSDTPQLCRSKTYTLLFFFEKSKRTLYTVLNLLPLSPTLHIYIYCISISNFLNQMCTSPWQSLDIIASKPSLFYFFDFILYSANRLWKCKWLIVGCPHVIFTF